MIIAYSSLCCKYIDDVLDVAIKNKDRAIEWDMNFIPPTLSQRRIDYIKKCKEYNDLKFSFHLPYSYFEIADEDILLRKNSIETLQRYMLFATALGSDDQCVVLHIGTTNKSNISIACDSLEKLSSFADSIGLFLCVENLITGLTANVKNLSTLLSVPNVYLCFDTGHADVLSKQDSNYFPALSSCMIKCKHAHVYKTEINNMHKSFNSIASYKNSKIVKLLYSSNCEWFTIELEDFNDQEAQERVMSISTIE